MDFQQKRLYISTNSRRLSDNDLYVYFSSFGEVDLAYFVKNHNKSKDKVFFGYVNFKSDDSVRLVMATPKHFINKQEVKCDTFRPKKRSCDSIEGEKPKAIDHTKKTVPHSSTRPHHHHVLFKQKTTDTQTVLSSEEKKMQPRDSIRLPIRPELHAELRRLSGELHHNHLEDNIRFNVCSQRPAVHQVPVSDRSRR